MDLLRGLTLLLLCQSAGEALSRVARLPLPGPVVGMLLLVLLLQVWPAVRPAAGAASDGLLAHLSLLFVPVGAGVVAHLDLVTRHGPGMVLALVVSTMLGLATTAWVLRSLIGVEAPGADL
jgi:holin-like protein